MRLIDADAIQIPSTCVDMFENCRNCKLLDEEQVREIIDNAPTIEPKKGKWILHPDDLFPAESTMECSVCHEHEYFSLCNENFCPNCGADMRGKDDE